MANYTWPARGQKFWDNQVTQIIDSINDEVEGLAGDLSGRLSNAQLDARIASGTTRFSPSYVERIAFGGDSNSSYNGGQNWTSMLTALSRGRAIRTALYATGGITIEGWRDSHLPTVLSTTGRDRPHAIVLMLGTNNVLQNVASAISLYENEVIRPLRAAGIEAWICSIPPREGSSQSWGREFNHALYEMTQRLCIPLLPVYEQLVDPTNGNFKAGWAVNGVDGSGSYDPVHFFKQEAQAAVAVGLRDKFLSLLRGGGVRWPQVNDDTRDGTWNYGRNTFANALMLTGGGKFNGANNNPGLALGWQSSAGLTIASGGPSLFSDPYGSWQRLKDIDTTTIQNQKLDVPVTAGQRIEFMAKLRPSGFGGDAARFGLQSSFYAASSGGSPISSFGVIENQRPNLIDLSRDPSDFLSLRAEGVVPSGANFLRITAVYTGGGASLVGKTFDYGSFAVRPMP